MSEYVGTTIKELAGSLGVVPDTVRLWIKKGKLSAVRQNGKLLVPLDIESNNSFFIEQLNKKVYRPKKPFVAEKIKAYAQWHELLDEFTLCTVTMPLMSPMMTFRCNRS